MAENTLLKREDDNHNKYKHISYYPKSHYSKLAKTVMQHVFTKTTSNSKKKSGCIKYPSTCNSLSVLFPNIYLIVFWTLCQCNFSEVISATNVSDPVISAVSYIGYLKRAPIESIIKENNVKSHIDVSESIDILLEVNGNNIEKIENWKATQNDKLCIDKTNLFSKTKHASLVSYDGHNEKIEVLLSFTLRNSVAKNAWFLCIPDRTNSYRIENGKNHVTNWMHLGPFSRFRLPDIYEKINVPNEDKLLTAHTEHTLTGIFKFCDTQNYQC